jgi:hypothetical protein
LVFNARATGQGAAPDMSSRQPSAWEYFGGAAVVGVVSGTGARSLIGPNLSTPFSIHDGAQNGVHAAVIRKLGPHFGLKLDFSTYLRDQFGTGVFDNNLQIVNARSRLTNFLVGPEWKWHRGARVTPWVNTLAGATLVRSTYSTAGLFSMTSKETRVGGTLAVGGGFDVRIVRRASFRLGADYAPLFLGAPLSDSSRIQHQVRFVIGLKLH